MWERVRVFLLKLPDPDFAIIFENGRIVEEFPDKNLPDDDKSDEGTQGPT